MAVEEFRTAWISLRRCKEICSRPFIQPLEPSWLAEANFTLLLINLKDVCQILRKYGERLNFADDIPDGRDITDLITDVRNAICHIGSPLRHLEPGLSLSFNIVLGAGTFIATPTISLGNPYADDIAIFYGKHRLLLKRHVHRAIAEAEAQIREKAQTENWLWINWP